MKEFLIYTKIRHGDIRAFEMLFRQYYEALCLYSNRIVDDMSVSEEIVQELFYKLWKDRHSIKIRLSVKSYLYGAVRNQSLQYLEHLKVREQYHRVTLDMDMSNPTPLDVLEYNELKRQYESVLENLPKRRREIFQMSRIEGKSYEQIARELSLSVKTIEAEISKTLQTLRKNIKNI